MNNFYFLQENYITRVSEFVGLGGDRLDALLRDLKVAAADKELTNLVLEWKNRVFTSFEPFEEIPYDIKWNVPETAPLLPLAALFAGFDDLLDYYTRNNIPQSVLTDTLYDAVRKLDISMAADGKYAIEDVNFCWLIRHFNGWLFHLGSLQFEALRLDDDKNELLKKGDYVINVHIPANTDLSHEKVEASYKQAADFYRKLMPDIPFKAFICESWMLSPQLKELLPASSNLVYFQSDYQLYEASDDKMIYVFVYQCKPDDLNELPTTTSLQRILKQHLLSGGEFLSGYGFFPLDNVI